MEQLQERFERGEVVILDGAIGTELQRMGVPMDSAAWCATAMLTDPDTVRQLHEDYIRLGADIITTNTYASARHNFEAAGIGDKTRGLNTLAVKLAQDARNNAAGGRRVYIAGSMSNYGAFPVTVERPAPSDAQLKADYREQATTLVEAGVDFIILELIRDVHKGTAIVEAVLATGLPVWIAFTCKVDEEGTVKLRTEIGNPEEDISFAAGIEALTALGGAAIAVMHSEVDDTAPALGVALNHWQGPIGAYPHSGSWKRPNWNDEQVISPEDYLVAAQQWVEMGVQIIGGCCGIGRKHIELLKQRLPTHIPPRTGR